MSKPTLKIKSTEKSKLWFFLLTILLGIVICATLPRLSIPLLIAYIIYLIINPAVPFLVKLGLTRQVAVGCVFVTFTFLAVYPVVKVFPVLKNETEKVQYYLPKVEQFIRNKYYEVKSFAKVRFGYEIEDKMLLDGLDYAKNFSGRVILSVPRFVASTLEWVFIVPLFLFFFLKDARSFTKLFLNMTPNSLFERLYYLTHQFNKKLGDYIFAKFIEASIVGLVITVGLLIIDIRFAFLLGIIAAVTNIIPYVGPLLGIVPGVIIALMEHGVGTTFWAVVILFLVANVIDLALVFPILVSKIVDLHPIIVVVSVILGSQYMGLMGMIISIPLAAAIKLIIQEVYKEIYLSS